VATIFVEFNKKFKGKIPEELKEVVDELKQKNCMRLRRPIAKQVMNLGVGNWVSRNVGKKREKA